MKNIVKQWNILYNILKYYYITIKNNGIYLIYTFIKQFIPIMAKLNFKQPLL